MTFPDLLKLASMPNLKICPACGRYVTSIKKEETMKRLFLHLTFSPEELRTASPYPSYGGKFWGMKPRLL